MKRKLAQKDVCVLAGVTIALVLPLIVMGRVRSRTVSLPIGSIREGVISPDGMHLATLEQPPKESRPSTTFDLVVRSLPSGEETVRMPFRIARARLRWSNNGQYIVIDGSEGALVDVRAGFKITTPRNFGKRWWLLPESDLMLGHGYSDWKIIEVSKHKVKSLKTPTKEQHRRLTNALGSQEPRPLSSEASPPRYRESRFQLSIWPPRQQQDQLK